MSFIHSINRTEFKFYFSKHPALFYVATSLVIFFVYSSLDYINTFIFSFYPIYHSVYAQGAADSVYFTRAADKLLSFKIPTSNFDGGLLAIFIYSIPVSFSNFFRINTGFSFRIFYLVILLLTGFGIYLVGKELYSDYTGLKLAFAYIFNPLIFILSVWAGSEEIIEALLFVFILYFVVHEKLYYAILLTLVACTYKYYSVLLIPIIILSFKDSRTQIKITAILTGFFVAAIFILLLFLNKYVMNVINTFITTFHLHGKGVFYLLVEYGNIKQIEQPFGLLYYFMIGLVILLFIWLTRNSDDLFKYGMVFILFFLLYPEFYSSYLIIPLIPITLMYPKVSLKFPIITMVLLTISSFLSEFSFTLVDSPYNLLHITPTPLLRGIGIIFLFILYAIMVYWIVVYYNLIHKNSIQKTTME